MYHEAGRWSKATSSLWTAADNALRGAPIKSASIERTEVKQLLAINNSNLHMIKKANPANNVYWEVLRLGEIHNGIPSRSVRNPQR